MKYINRLPFSVLPFLALSLVISCQGLRDKNADNEVKKQSLKNNIGEQFRLSGIADSTGNNVALDFSKSDITIIDFWFNECPPCINEMNRFVSLLPGKEKKVTVISISINQFGLWKETLKAHSGKFSFLSSSLPNWTHYVLQTKDDASLKNEISADRVAELQKSYNITFFPAFFVIDKKGTILSRPESAADYISQL